MSWLGEKLRIMFAPGNRLITILLIILVILFIMPDKPKRGTIYITSTVREKIQPDSAKIIVGIENSAKTAKEVAEINKNITTKVIAELEEKLSEDESIKTIMHRVYPEREYDRTTKQSKQIGYIAQDRLEVNVEDISKVETLLDRAISAGATRIDGVKFALVDENANCAELLSKATIQARDKASKILEPMKLSVKGIKDMKTYCSARGGHPRAMLRAERAGNGYIKPDMVELKANVTVNFLFD